MSKRFTNKKGLEALVATVNEEFQQALKSGTIKLIVDGKVAGISVTKFSENVFQVGIEYTKITETKVEGLDDVEDTMEWFLKNF